MTVKRVKIDTDLMTYIFITNYNASKENEFFNNVRQEYINGKTKLNRGKNTRTIR